MKKTALILSIFVFFQGNLFGQKLDSILNRSTLSFNYGVAHDFFSCCIEKNPNLPVSNFSDKNEIGEIFGFEYGYRTPGKKNEWGFGFAKQVSRRDITATVQTRYALVEIQGFRLRDTKNFHYLFLKRHFIDEKLIGSLGFYNLRYRDSRVEVVGNSDQTIVSLSESSINIDFGIFLGVEYYYPVRNFQIGLRSRLYYTQGYSESFESFEISPVIRFKL